MGIVALHRMREQLVKFRTAEINCLRRLLAEHGELVPQGRAGLKPKSDNCLVLR